MSCHSSGSLEGGCPSSTEVIEDTEGLYNPGFFAVERFMYLRDFLNYFGLIDLFISEKKMSCHDPSVIT